MQLSPIRAGWQQAFFLLANLLTEKCLFDDKERNVCHNTDAVCCASDADWAKPTLITQNEAVMRLFSLWSVCESGCLCLCVYVVISPTVEDL